METLLIDIGALAVFLGYMAVVYWHAVSHAAQPHGHALIDLSGTTGAQDRSDVPRIREPT